MSQTTIVHDFFIFILPSICLYILGTYIAVRSHPYKLAKLLSGSIFLIAIGYTVDYISVLLPTEANYTWLDFIVLTVFNASLTLIIYMFYDMVKIMKPTRIKWMPHVLYGFCIVLIAVSYFESVVLNIPTYANLDKMGLSSALLNIGIVSAVLVLFYVRFKYVNVKEYRIFLKIWMTYIVLLFGLVLLWKLDLVPFINYIVPATPGLLCLALTCILLVYSTVKLNLAPSAVKRYVSLLETSATPIVILNQDKQIIECNESAKLEHQMKINTDFRAYFKFKNEQAILDDLFTRLDVESAIKGFRMDYLSLNGEGKIALIDTSKKIIADKTYYYLFIHEVTEEFQRRNLNEHLAYHDFLTGIYNRTYFEEEVKKKLALHHDRDGALIICDLNFFKEINDTYGHQTGDNVLIFTANCWHENLPHPHILARLGGDEFVMFFEKVGMKEQFLKDINEARNAFKTNLYRQDDTVIEVVPSIGISFVEEDGIDYEQLYHICDKRMFEDKKKIKKEYKMKVK